MCDFINPGILGNPKTFRKVYETPIALSREPSASNDVKELGRKRMEELQALTSSFILRRTSNVNKQYLPPKSKPYCLHECCY